MSVPKKKGKGPPQLNLGDLGAKASDQNSPTFLAAKLQDLAIPENLKLDLKVEHFSTLAELGMGNGGTVSKVLHTPSNQIMARKVPFI